MSETISLRDAHLEEMQARDKAKHNSIIDRCLDRLAEYRGQWDLAVAASKDNSIITELSPNQMVNNLRSRWSEAECLLQWCAGREARRYGELVRYLERMPEDEQQCALDNYNRMYAVFIVPYEQERQERRAKYLADAEANVNYDIWKEESK